MSEHGSGQRGLLYWLISEMAEGAHSRLKCIVCVFFLYLDLLYHYYVIMIFKANAHYVIRVLFYLYCSTYWHIVGQQFTVS